MPELLEVETYRQQAMATVGRRVAEVEVLDPSYWRGVVGPDVLGGQRITGVRRIGKLMLVDTEAVTLGVRFGMTGRLIVDGTATIGRLEYSSPRDLPEWHRIVVHFHGGGSMIVTDPRRLGWVEIDPDETLLGVDASGISLGALRKALTGSAAALKSRLMDQRRIAGLGNLLTDEILWRAGLDPRRAAGGLTPAELRRLHRHVGAVLIELGERGGSHTGDLQPARQPGALCPRDGEPLRRDAVGGRTTWWCPAHQR